MLAAQASMGCNLARTVRVTADKHVSVCLLWMHPQHNTVLTGTFSVLVYCCHGYQKEIPNPTFSSAPPFSALCLNRKDFITPVKVFCRRSCYFNIFCIRFFISELISTEFERVLWAHGTHLQAHV